MQSATAGIAVGGSCLAGVVELFGGGIGVADVGIGQNTKAHAQVPKHPKAAYNVFKVSVVGIFLDSAFLEVGNLSGQARIKKKRQTVELCI